jgi:hypothetical protein
MSVLLAASLVLLPITAAQAAVPGAPGGLTPSGITTSGIPALTWNRVSGATGYNLQYSTDSDFATGVTKVSTVNRRYVPKAALPAATIWWRVQAKNSNGAGEWSTTSFDVNPTAGPALTAPSDGQLLNQPDDPVLLSWTPVSGALSYTVQLDDDPGDFVTPVSTTSGIKTTAYIVQNPHIATTYHWHVRAQFDGAVVSDWSDVRSFSVGGLADPVLVAPADSVNTTVDDVVLKWQSVPGAVHYNLQVSTDCTFATVTYSASGLAATTYSPLATFDNDQYCWRVQPEDAFGNQVAWEGLPIWHFKRDWPLQPSLEYPITPNGQPTEIVSTPVYYQWTGVKLASKYRLQVSTSSTFPPGSATHECVTTQTTFVPATGSPCTPAVAPSINYWRVIAYDGPNDVQTQPVNAEIQSFLYDPLQVDLSSISPADNSTTAEPVFSWDPVQDAARYRISVVALDGGSNAFSNRITTTTSYSPVNPLTPGKSYRWFVEVGNRSGNWSPVLTPAAWPTFTVGTLSASNSTIVQTAPANGSTFHRFPQLDWEPVQGAAYYTVEVRDPASPLTAPVLIGTQFAYSAAEDVDYTGLPRDFEWRVNAYNDSDTLVAGPSGWRSFTIASLGTAGMSGFEAAMTGLSTESTSTSCTTAQCLNMKQTPVFRWDAVPDAGSYEFWLCPTATCESPVSGYPKATDEPMFTPSTPLPEAQAGSAYWWRVMPCTSTTSGISDVNHTAVGCTPFQTAVRSINKKANPVELLTPVDGAVGPDTVTFSWRDYLATNLDATHKDTTSPTPVNARVEAYKYRIQVSTVPNFQTLVDQADVDQTTYTATTKLYPDNVLYWRVIALDASGDPLAYTQQYAPNTPDVRTFTKTTPAPSLKPPGSGGVILQWNPANFAASYNVEVYKNDDTLGQSGNKVFSGNSKQDAISLSSPLPASATPYRWRIQKVDETGNKGAWTSLSGTNSSFTVSAPAPTQTSPAASALVKNNDGYFSWTAVQGAKSYRFERRKSGTTTLSETSTTAALAWAPQSTITDGTWQWRVVAIDTAGKDLGASAWRTFVVDGTKPTVISFSPRNGATGVSTGANMVAKFSEKITGLSTSTVRLYRSGTSTAVSATVTANSTHTAVTLNPTRSLVHGAKYYFKLSSGIKDLHGNTLTGVSASFTVAR